MSRPTTAFIDTAAMQHNLARIKALAPGSKIWAVIKANGYGHHLHHAVKGFSQADGFALIEPAYAVQLRQASPDRELILLEGAFDSEGTKQALQYQIRLTVHHMQQVQWLEQAALQGFRPVALNVKFNCGMNRLGFDGPGLLEAIGRLYASGYTRLTLMTHFADADVPGGITVPWQRFGGMQAAVKKQFPNLVFETSCANSAACFDHPHTHGDWVRPGVALYGATPFGLDRNAIALGLKPAMGLYSNLIAVQQLQPGDAVGYGSTYVAKRPMRIGVVACGYADGYPRHAPSGTPVWVGGVKTATVGRVAMDMLMVDLTDIDHAQIGTETELWGARLLVDEVAVAAGTIGYELLCALAPRVPVVEQSLRQ
jgi:alanine racemase